MKQLLLITAFLVVGICNGQKVFTQYSSEYWPDNKQFDIEVSEENGKLDAVWINVRTLDDLYPNGTIKIVTKRLPDFIAFIQASKAKYVEWENTAKQNNVEDLSKEIDIKKFTTRVGFEYGKWQFTNASLVPRFFLTKGKANLLFATGNLTSSSNQFMKSEGLALIFASPEEVDDFIKLLDVVKMQQFIDSNTTKTELFK